MIYITCVIQLCVVILEVIKDQHHDFAKNSLIPPFTMLKQTIYLPHHSDSIF
jgi:hypothetical protein